MFNIFTCSIILPLFLLFALVDGAPTTKTPCNCPIGSPEQTCLMQQLVNILTHLVRCVPQEQVNDESYQELLHSTGCSKRSPPAGQGPAVGGKADRVVPREGSDFVAKDPSLGDPKVDSKAAAEGINQQTTEAATTTTDPSSSTTDPSSTTTDPSSTTTDPSSTTTDASSSTTESTEQDSTTEPGSTTTEQDSLSDQDLTTTDPSATTTDPSSTTTDQSSTTTEQDSTTDLTTDPSSTTIDPSSTTTDPSSTTADPSSTTTDPSSTTADPSSTTIDPSSSTSLTTESRSKLGDLDQLAAAYSTTEPGSSTETDSTTAANSTTESDSTTAANSTTESDSTTDTDSTTDSSTTTTTEIPTTTDIESTTTEPTSTTTEASEEESTTTESTSTTTEPAEEAASDLAQDPKPTGILLSDSALKTADPIRSDLLPNAGTVTTEPSSSSAESTEITTEPEPTTPQSSPKIGDPKTSNARGIKSPFKETGKQAKETPESSIEPSVQPENYHAETFFIPVLKFHGGTCMSAQQLRDHLFNLFTPNSNKNKQCTAT